MSDQSQSALLLSTFPSRRRDRRAALVVSLLLLAALLGSLPFARVSWPPFPAFILVQQSLLLANDLITAVLLFGQYALGRTRGLNILAGGYLFTALIVIPHALTFPGIFSDTGWLGAGPQSAAWLYIGWHSILPLTTIVFALHNYSESAEDGDAHWSVQITSATAVMGVLLVTLLATLGHKWLPPLVENNHYTAAARISVGTLMVLPLVAVLVLARKRYRSVLDEWLLVMMSAWLMTIALGAFISSGRYDAGWYLGRAFDWLSSVIVLIMLLSETLVLYAWNARAAASERLQRERRLKEIEAVTIHLSRISELGQNLSTFVHEIGQPIMVVSMLARTMKQSDSASKVLQLVEPLVESAEKAITLSRHLGDLIKNNRIDLRDQEIPEIIEAAIRLVSLGDGSVSAVTINTRYGVDATTAFFDRVQIEQVVSNLVRNAVEAMADSRRRVLTIATTRTPEDMIEISIADTGSGLPSAVRSKLFEPFVTTKASGLGIGLSICRVIIEAHGGELRAEDNPGGGTIFRFTLLRELTTRNDGAR